MSQRTVLVNRCRKDERIFIYPFNAVYTTKYGILTFIPKFLYEQFSRYANLFFLAVAIIQQFPGLSPVSRYGTAFPLGIILLLTAFKEVAEDLRRRAADQTANNEKCEVFDRNKNEFSMERWSRVRVGDVLRIKCDEYFPADLVILQSSNEEDGSCYVETSNIDGESNLKVKFSSLPLEEKVNLNELTGIIKCDPPNNQIHEFEGVFVHADKETSLTSQNLLLRGAALRNTEWIVGVVVYTGRDTKLLKSARVTRIKRSTVELTTNRLILSLVLLLFLIISCCLVIFIIVTRLYSSLLPYTRAADDLSFGRLIFKFLSYLVLMNNLVPISLLMTLEFIRVYLGALINEDLEMYCEETDTRAVAKTSSLIEELGQIKYIFSDKTGTLTRNEMVLRKISFNGETHGAGDNQEEWIRNEQASLLLEIISTCHSVIVGRDKENNPNYQSSSPDEVAITQYAADCGFRLLERRSNSLRVVRHKKEVKVYQIMAELEFTSNRKRMSVLLKNNDGSFVVFCKGADSVISGLLSEKQNSRVFDYTQEAVNDMAKEGLRTLVFAYKNISEKDATEWLREWNDVRKYSTIGNQEERLNELAKKLESNLYLAGATGVEDRLQEAVPQTISLLHAANIKLWVLTGDKLETALSIGYSCQLLDPLTKVYIISSIQSIFDAVDEMGVESKHEGEGEERDTKFAMMIEPVPLDYLLKESSLHKRFLSAASKCSTVICCRVSPSQKARVVDLVQRNEGAVCLAIGDGANDVEMIQTANIGVGMSGKEGLQASRCADFSIAKFRFLSRLILVHGSWGYHRISKAATFCVYKNILLYACQLWFTMVSLASGQTLFESWMIGLYNVVFTAWPPIIIGIMDQYVTAPFLLSNPSLYRHGQSNSFYNSKTFWASAINGFWQSLVAIHLTVLTMLSSQTLADGKQISLFFMGSTVFAGIVITATLKAALLTNYWTFLTVVGYLTCPITWILYVIFYDVMAQSLVYPVNFFELLGMSHQLFSSPIFYLCIVLVPLACLSRDFVWKFSRRQFSPQEYHIIQELQRQQSISRDNIASSSSFSKLNHLI